MKADLQTLIRSPRRWVLRTEDGNRMRGFLSSNYHFPYAHQDYHRYDGHHVHSYENRHYNHYRNTTHAVPYEKLCS